MVVPLSPHEAWAFFSKPANLKVVTPPEMNLTLAPKELPYIEEGLRLQFKVAPAMGIELNWETTIVEVKEPYRFVDKQTEGPFAYWRHEHIFAPAKNGTEIIDRLSYKMPFGTFGTLAYPFGIKSKICELFEFRKQKINQLFGLVQPK